MTIYDARLVDPPPPKWRSILDDTVTIEVRGKSICSCCGVVVPGVGFGDPVVALLAECEAK